MRKNLLIVLSLLFMSIPALAKEAPVVISPMHKLTTADRNFVEGNEVVFVVTKDTPLSSTLALKKGDKVYGTVISIEENGFLGQVANTYIENFYAKDSSGKRINLKGVVYKKGTCHDVITGFLSIFMVVIRGGEVQIKPQLDNFTIYTEAI